MRILFLFFMLYAHLMAFEYVITSSELNNSVAKKFPIERSLLFSKFIFAHPNFTIDKKSNTILFSCEVTNNAFVLNNGDIPIFKVYTKSAIRYDGDSIYLKNIEVEHIYNKYISPQLEKQLIMSSEVLLNLYFSKRAIYRLDNANYAIRVMHSAIRDIVIDDGAIKVKI
jgi:hypothetical protein